MNVDDGYTWLTSPPIETAGSGALIRYARWYANDYPVGEPHNDIFKVFVRCSGTSWVTAETVGPAEQASGGWYAHEFWLSDFSAPADSLYLRFEASDFGLPSVIEAGIDAVSVTAYSWDPLIVTDSVLDWTVAVAYSHQLDVAGCSDPYTWSDKNGDLPGTGLTLSGSGLVSGTPVSWGEISFVAEVTDDSAGTEIATDALPPARQGESYTHQLLAVGGTGGHTWTDKNGDLAGTGLAIDSAGLLHGVPVDTGTTAFLARVEDQVGAFDEQSLVLDVGPAYICGDVDGSGENPNVADLTYLVTYLFQGGPAPPVTDAANVDGIVGPAGPVDVSDLTHLVAYLFQGGPAPVCE
jgi:hypothetical protein